MGETARLSGFLMGDFAALCENVRSEPAKTRSLSRRSCLP
jgi:hypothetical protein